MFGEKPQLFRKSALERLSTPERLDTLMQVTRPKGWIALIALIAILTAAIGWGVLGRVPQIIQGRGIVLTRDGVRTIQAHGAGVVIGVDIRMGDTVAEGQVVARIAQPELLEEMENLEFHLRELSARRVNTGRYVEENVTLTSASIEAQTRQVEEASRATRERIAFLEERVTQQREARSLGLITNEHLQNTVQQLADARASLQGFEAKLRDLAS